MRAWHSDSTWFSYPTWHSYFNYCLHGAVLHRRRFYLAALAKVSGFSVGFGSEPAWFGQISNFVMVNASRAPQLEKAPSQKIRQIPAGAD